MQRERVYKIIDGERDYQNGIGAESGWNTTKRVGEFLTLLDIYVGKAKQDWLRESDSEEDRPSLAQVRKIAALAVACMETHGAPEREGSAKTPEQLGALAQMERAWQKPLDNGTVRIPQWNDGLPNIKP